MQFELNSCLHIIKEMKTRSQAVARVADRIALTADYLVISDC